MSAEERERFEAPADGVFTITLDGTEHDYVLDEGDEVVFEWERDPA